MKARSALSRCSPVEIGEADVPEVDALKYLATKFGWDKMADAAAKKEAQQAAGDWAHVGWKQARVCIRTNNASVDAPAALRAMQRTSSQTSRARASGSSTPSRLTT